MTTMTTLSGSTGLPAVQPTWSSSDTSSTPVDTSAAGYSQYDQPDATYTALTKAHVELLRTIGTPETVLQQLNASQPDPQYLENYIQGEIMHNPEGWDDYVGNPRGTARAGLQQLLSGNIGSQPVSVSAGDETEGLVKGIVMAGIATGIGLLGWKYLKGRNAAPAAESVMNLVGGGGSEVVGAGMRSLAGPVGGVERSVLGGGLGSVSDVHLAATLDSISRGHGAANGFLNSVGASAVAFNLNFERAAELALADRGMSVLEQLARNGGTVADLVAARAVAAAQAGGAAGVESATQLAGLKSALAGITSLVV